MTGLFLILLIYALLSRELRPPPAPGGPGGPNGGAGQVVGAGDGYGPPESTPAITTDDNVANRVFEARREERAGALRRVPRVAIFALLIATVAAIALSWLVAGRMLQPLRAITRHARDASQHTLSDRIALGGPRDELRELADTMDAMLARLQAAFDSQRHFAAQASHELRTPLAIIQAEADVALASPDALPRERALATAVRTAAVRSERLVDGLLALSRSESSMVERLPLDVADLTGDVVGELIGEADAAGLAIDLQLDAAPVEGDRALLERLVANLVRNAIRYNRTGGWIRIAVATQEAARRRTAVLTVVNAGPAIPAGEVEALFEPFQRGANAARARVAGFGLGLSIVRSVAAVHGGNVTARPGPEGGLEVRVELPSSAAGDRSA